MISIPMLQIPAFEHANEQVAKKLRPVREVIRRAMSRALEIPVFAHANRQVAKDLAPLSRIIRTSTKK